MAAIAVPAACLKTALMQPGVSPEALKCTREKTAPIVMF